MIKPNTALKGGYNRGYQFLQLISNTVAITPIDIWQPSGYFTDPQIIDQVSIGLSQDSKNERIGFTLETYYKWMQNVLDFKDGANLILNPNLETELLQGKGKSYGVEASLIKRTGKMTGAVNYTFQDRFEK